ncbi:dTDP-4-dehydrorhamnose 3,5-epimerase [Alkalihalobacillus xiaoxiensis]|uniref:dTDP-4-dehydrorhamnose 3,5-epimerase n=1 Tax=Shouchella xiaoxiensis TaxID=766895 RepID=A0ABS2SV79_9BACI|nr:dTDP-4-dehydrorhamnose 3,5-epimerase [Shouchella xiaoxiensis]MBM7839407.1 dTDP-4-dehydrorhamnose 3,5-epimerase [Shouchella xiaoxiensis]
MIKADLVLNDVWIIEPDLFGDHRGWFMETYNNSVFMKNGININFVQDNHSFSAQKGTLRGLHYQLNPKAQTKLVRCTKGSIFDVAVDLRVDSQTFGKWTSAILSESNKKQFLVPKGFAHGFITLEDDVEVQYKVDEYYSSTNDRSILWSDPNIGIKWPQNLVPILSNKDKFAPLLLQAEINYEYGDL